MQDLLSDRQIQDTNQLIDHCERLMRARGRSNGRSGTYESPPFAIFFRRDKEESNLQVNYQGRTVLRAQWTAETTPGHAYTEPGPWRAEFLKLQAAHA